MVFQIITNLMFWVSFWNASSSVRARHSHIWRSYTIDTFLSWRVYWRSMVLSSKGRWSILYSCSGRIATSTLRYISRNSFLVISLPHKQLLNRSSIISHIYQQNPLRQDKSISCGSSWGESLTILLTPTITMHWKSRLSRTPFKQKTKKKLEKLKHSPRNSRRRPLICKIFSRSSSLNSFTSSNTHPYEN